MTIIEGFQWDGDPDLHTAQQRTVCAWCQRVLREGVEPTSHGICPACEASMVWDGVAGELGDPGMQP